MIPDVTGFTLGEALQILKDAGVNKTVVKLTAPPRNIDAEYSDDSRVVRVRLDDVNGTVEIIVCNIG